MLALGSFPILVRDLVFRLNSGHLEGQGDVVSRLTMGITWVSIRVIEVTHLLTKSA